MHESYKYGILLQIDNFSVKSVETLFLKIHKFPSSDKQTTILRIIYRPPQLPINPFIEDLDKALMHIGKLIAKVHIAGDFNLDNSSYPVG